MWNERAANREKFSEYVKKRNCWMQNTALLRLRYIRASNGDQLIKLIVSFVWNITFQRHINFEILLCALNLWSQKHCFVQNHEQLFSHVLCVLQSFSATIIISSSYLIYQQCILFYDSVYGFRRLLLLLFKFNFSNSNQALKSSFKQFYRRNVVYEWWFVHVHCALHARTYARRHKNTHSVSNKHKTNEMKLKSKSQLLWKYKKL